MADLLAVLDAIDAANSDDPNIVDGEPRALLEGQLATQWISQLTDAPSETLVIAARAHHLRRWALPRTDYPEGRAGYLRWRRDQKRRHGEEVAPMMVAAGYGPADVARTAELLERGGLGVDLETQHLEDAACLAFLETQYEATIDRLEDDQMVTVVAKTLKKMSPRAIDLAGTLPMTDRGGEVLRRAVERLEPQGDPG